MIDIEKIEKQVAEWLEEYTPKHLTTDLGWVILDDVVKERYKQDAIRLLKLLASEGMGFMEEEEDKLYEAEVFVFKSLKDLLDGELSTR